MFKSSKKKNNEAGAVTIEATIALTAFLFMFLMIYSIITICRAQAHIQIAISSTAKEISQYSYIYGLTGLDGSLAKFQESAGDTKSEVNGVVGNVAGVFEGIQSIGDAGASLDVTDPDALMNSYGEISKDLDDVKGNTEELGEKIQSMAEDPQSLLLGLAKLIGSESLELAKSRAIAEPVSKALVKKHLKRSNDDNAEDFCKALGIRKGSYFGKESHFNGLDFSNSTLFPYGSDEINIVVTYKVRILPLLPVDLEYTITQSAVTRGWLHGDMSDGGVSPSDRVEAITKKGESLWNTATVSERTELIRHMGIADLKKEGYSGVSNENYIHAYDQASKTFAMVASSNPLWEAESLSDINKEELKENLNRLAAQMKSTTDNKETIKIKKVDEKTGNLSVESVSCKGATNKKIILVIPEDEGLKQIYEEATKGIDGVTFEIVQSYGKVFKTEKEDEEGGEE